MGYGWCEDLGNRRYIMGICKATFDQTTLCLSGLVDEIHFLMSMMALPNPDSIYRSWIIGRLDMSPKICNFG